MTPKPAATRPKLASIERRVSNISTAIAAPEPTSLGFNDPRRGSAASRGYGPEWQRLRLQILRRDGFRCVCNDCKAASRLLPAHVVDHIIPKSEGGGDDPLNLQSMNKLCHDKKTAREKRHA
jgi:5-methylcytosine-specific restriction protein A